jgi:hypothetical protein
LCTQPVQIAVFFIPFSSLPSYFIGEAISAISGGRATSKILSACFTFDFTMIFVVVSATIQNAHREQQ